MNKYKGIVIVCGSLGLLACGKPTTIPAERLDFIGIWDHGKVFRLEIMPEGTAIIRQDKADRGPAYENLSIKVAPSVTEKLNVNFTGQKHMQLIKRFLYGREYRIDRRPYAEDGQMKMVLNGVELLKNP